VLLGLTQRQLIHHQRLLNELHERHEFHRLNGAGFAWPELGHVFRL
jgi:hypothetical protein